MTRPSLISDSANDPRPGRRRRLLAALFAAGLAGTAATPILADADILVTILGDSAGVEAVLTAASGTSQRADDPDGDGVLYLVPRAGAGSYQITVTVGGISETASVEVPRIGTVSIQFDPGAAQGSRIQSETISRVESITVTGLRREQELQQVSASVEALTAETLESMGADEFTDYARSVPALNFADLGPNRTEINLRGMGRLTAGTATVGLYIDDVAVTDSFNNPDLRLFDVERIEVLRGPQGTLYGEASMGGAIRVLTAQADPSGSDFKFEGTVSDTSGGGENHAANAMVNVPAPRDTFALRLVGYTRDLEGWIDNPILGLKDLNHADIDGGRLSGRWLASDRSMVTVTGTLQQTDVGGQPFTTEGLGDLEQFTSLPESDEEDMGQGVVNVSYLFDWAELAAIGGWVDRTYDRVIDFGFPVNFASDQRILSGEVRLHAVRGSFDWVAGTYYKKWDQDNSLIAPDIFGPGVDFANFVEFNTENLSLFGEVIKAFSPKWSGTLGARIFDEDRHDPFIQSIGGEIFDQSDLRSSESDILPKVGFAFDANDNLKVYFVGAEGYRSGGVNPIVSLNPDAPPTYEADTNRSFELGVKTSSQDHKLILNVSLFHVDWENMQISGTPDNSALGYTTNAGDAHTQGIEAELWARVFSGFDLIVGGALLEAELDDAAEGGEPGNRLPHTVEESFNVGAQYTFELTQRLAAVVRGDVMYRGDAFSDVRNRAIDATDSYTLANLRFGVEGNRWGVFAFWDNVGDERAELVRFNEGVNVYRNQPETIGLTFRLNR